MLYYLNDDAKENVQMLKRTNLEEAGWKERDVEILVTKNVTCILNERDLMPIFTRRLPKEGPDVIALDKAGVLYLVKVKRGETDDNLLRVLRYGQIFGRKTHEELEDLFSAFNKSDKSLIEQHQEYFNLPEYQKLKKEEVNSKQQFLMVTESIDTKTQAAVHYWKKTGLPIDMVVYQIYTTNNEKTVLEVDAYSPYKNTMEKEEPFYIVNTNFTTHPDVHDDMIKQGKAAAYYHPWKHKIKKIENGDIVFLYKTGVGIVAMGSGSGIVEEETYQGVEGAEYSTKLEDFSILPSALNAAKISEITESEIEFNQTIVPLEKETGHLIWAYINEHMRRE